MTTSVLTQPWLWKRYKDNSIDTYVGVKDEPVVDLRTDPPLLRIMDGITPGGNPLGAAAVIGVQTPTVVSPPSGSSGIITSPVITGSGFSGLTSDFHADVHNATQWQVSTDPTYSTMDFSTSWDTQNLTAIDLQVQGVNLAPNSTYYIRVRYRGASGAISDWSPISAFDTTVAAPTNANGSLVGTTADQQDFHGYVVSFSGDGKTLAVASIYGAGGNSTSGNVTIFHHNGNAWAEQAVLISSDGQNNDWFGGSLSLSHNGNLLVVGAPNNDASGDNTGAIYIFTRTSSVWSAGERKTITGAQPDDRAGCAVAVSGDGTRIAIGVENGNGNVVNSGIVVLLEIVNGNWTQTATLQANDGLGSDRFGAALAFNYDGTVLAVGAPFSDYSGVSNPGASYVFKDSGSGLTQVKKLIPDDRPPEVYFGWAVDISRDGDRIVCGCLGNAGGVYLYTDTGSDWVQDVKLTSPDPVPGGNFGIGVTLTDNGTLLAVAESEGNGATTGDGAVHQYILDAGTWTLDSTVYNTAGVNNDRFGQSLAYSGNGDTLAVGAPRVNTNTGIVYLYD